MSTRPRSRLFALVLSIVPGWGHIYWGRERVGLGLFTAFAVAFFGLLNGLFIYLGPGQQSLVYGSLFLIVGISIASWIDMFRRTAPERVRQEDALRDRHLRDGMVAYLRGDLAAAKSSFLACVRVDPLDVDALFGMGMACSRSGDFRGAAAWLRRVRRYDDEGKWAWEIRQEIRRIRNGAKAAKPAAALGAAGASGDAVSASPTREASGRGAGAARRKPD